MRSSALAAVAAGLVLAACSPTMRAGLQTLQGAWPQASSVRDAPLDHRLVYLLVTHQGREALMVWSGDEPGPLGPTRVWVGADGVVLRTHQGRMVGVSEPTRSWRVVAQAPVPGLPQGEQQTVDLQPGYRLGLQQTVVRMPLPTPLSEPSTLAFHGPVTGLQWEEENVMSVSARSSLQVGLLARNAQGQVVYGERCLTPEWCLSWQPWPLDRPGQR
ncbi:MAG: hypothetical protein C4K60_12555 [Ideonella sp. MAG2]|nr:MAG: hypothetical protein C4K60_12555 [Ideonella sp. MAG2]